MPKHHWVRSLVSVLALVASELFMEDKDWAEKAAHVYGAHKEDEQEEQEQLLLFEGVTTEFDTLVIIS
jgi:hypothetical protein